MNFKFALREFSFCTAILSKSSFGVIFSIEMSNTFVILFADA